MCFSASASFMTSAVLVPVGVYGLMKACQYDKRYLFFALIPLLFALQQFFEGLEWLCLTHGYEKYVTYLAKIYLFFAFSIYQIEASLVRRRLLIAILILGLILGVSIYAPVLWDSSASQVQVIKHSLCYQSRNLLFSDEIQAGIYLLLLLLSLFVSSHKGLKYWGLLLTLSFMVSYYFFYYVFTSVWCFFAAILSFFIVSLIPKNR